MKYFTYLLSVLLLAGTAHAAPTIIFEPNLLPDVNQARDLGSTTPAKEWNGVYTKNLYISGTCTGCGGSGGSGGISFSADTNYGQQVYSTSTPTLWFKSGLFASSTSYFGNLNTSGSVNIGTAGAVGAPAIFNSAIVNGATTGIWWDGNGQLDFSSTGVEHVSIRNLTNASLNTDGIAFNTAFGGGASVGLSRTSATGIEVNDASGSLGVFRDLAMRSATTTGATNLATLGGNVGIGTTNPATKLDVQGTASTTALNLPTSISLSIGTIQSNGVRFLHSYGTNNVFLGANAGNYTTTGNGTNVGVGRLALAALSSGIGNTALGDAAGTSINAGQNNTLIGVGTGAALTTGNSNVLIGANAGAAYNADGLVAIGLNAFLNGTGGTQNIAIGPSSLTNSGTTNFNTVIGNNSLQGAMTGDENTAIGRYACNGLTGAQNTCLGSATGQTLTSGSKNTFVGYNADVGSAVLTNATAIGANSVVAASNSIVLGGTGSNAVNVGIGTTSPWGRLSIGTHQGGTTIPLFVVASSSTSVATSTYMVILPSGNVGIGTTTPGSLFSIGGNGTGWNFFNSGTTTSYALGIDLLGGGCFAMSGTCLQTLIQNATAFKSAANYATNAVLSGTPTYANGTSGVGATLTEVGFGALSVDGASPTVGQRVLVKDQVDQTTNGIYTVTAVGSGIASYLLTRATDYNQSIDVYAGTTIPVLAGTANSDTTWTMTTTGTITMGSSNIVFAEAALGTSAVPTSRNINTTYPVQGGGNLTADRTLSLAFGTTTSNIWAGLQTFTNASSTQFSAASQNFYIDSTGHVAGKDTVNGWTGVVSPTRSLVLTSGTTTTWTASTTNSGYSPFIIAPFTGTVRQVRCATDASFLGVNLQVNGSNATPSYFVASTTVGTVAFTAGNTFSAGQKILANFGTTTTASTLAISCTFDVTETP